MADVAEQIQRACQKADFVVSLDVEGPTGPPYQGGSSVLKLGSLMCGNDGCWVQQDAGRDWTAVEMRPATALVAARVHQPQSRNVVGDS